MGFKVLYTIHMKRTNLVLDANILDEATRVLGLKTYSATVNRALAEVLRIRKIQSLSTFFASQMWEGDLAVMREDRVSPQRRRAQGRRRGPR
jgi:Arc/MetJ family transcription regulator